MDACSVPSCASSGVLLGWGMQAPAQEICFVLPLCPQGKEGEAGDKSQTPPEEF